MLHKLLAILCLLIFLPMVSNPETASSQNPGETITLGDFYLACSGAFKIKPPEGWDRTKAWLLLRATGLQVDGEQDFSQPLRHRHVIQIGDQLGIRFSSADPEELFSRKQVEAFLTRFQEYFRLPLRKSLHSSDTRSPADEAEPSQSSDKTEKN